MSPNIVLALALSASAACLSMTGVARASKPLTDSLSVRVLVIGHLTLRCGNESPREAGEPQWWNPCPWRTVHVSGQGGWRDSASSDANGIARFASVPGGLITVWCDTTWYSPMDGEMILKGRQLVMRPGLPGIDTLGVLRNFSGLYR